MFRWIEIEFKCKYFVDLRFCRFFLLFFFLLFRSFSPSIPRPPLFSPYQIEYPSHLVKRRHRSIRCMCVCVYIWYYLRSSNRQNMIAFEGKSPEYSRCVCVCVSECTSTYNVHLATCWTVLPKHCLLNF